MTGLSPRQADCLQAIRDLTFDGVPPTVAELSAHLGLNVSGAHRLLSALRLRGKVDWRKGEARSLYIVEDQVSPMVISRLSNEALRRTLAIAAGELAQRMGGGQAQDVLLRIADRLPGATKLRAA